jgi:hypothetical protein
VESIGDDLQSLDRHVVLSALNLTHMSPMQPTPIGKCILSPLPPQP